MFVKHIWKGIAAMAIIGTTLASCTKDDTPKKVYRFQNINLVDKDNVTNGYLTIAEITDTTFDVYMQINKSQMGVKYNFTFFRGAITAAPTDTLINFGSVTSQTTGTPVLVNRRIKEVIAGENATRKFNYDSIIAVNAFARISLQGSQGQDSAIATANIGSNITK
ncbi:hypothetical protein WJU16_12105 [Chitinophaga pollutisoli]|uniref:CHRD domain-containing protein n=1 Tax=Chitinophaga pollutisoli TaxID=3133966 RepID=A0ABZ2YVA3_9BACT